MKYTNADIKNLSPKLKEIVKKNLSYVDVKEQYSDQSHKEPRFSKGLFLYGITGSGKTYALHAINNCALRGFNSSGVETWVEVLSEIKDRMSQNQSSKYTIDAITSKEFVFLDDVGAEKQTDWVQENLYLLVDRCYRYEKTLFISTNLTIQEFSERYGDRLLSRLGEMCELYEMEAVDRRITQ